ncbi:MAG: AzlD domain-containing protein [Betaproteobacteria bacterium]|jgi:branched-subunit amino acid transport protein|nr:AzlD domain-containing protein [Betaproteobacteria bacterium]
MEWSEIFTAVGLGVITLVTRCFFFISDRALPFPSWAQRGLQYAPIAALAAVVVPEIVVSQGTLVTTWQDARLFGAAAGAGFYFYRRGKGQAVLGTIIVGMAVYLPLHVGWGW